MAHNKSPVLSVEAAAQGPDVHLLLLGGEVDRDVLVHSYGARAVHISSAMRAARISSGTLPPRTDLPKSHAAQPGAAEMRGKGRRVGIRSG
jgi:hypothetical protein